MTDPLRVELTNMPNDELMRMIAMCKEILATRRGRQVRADLTVVLHVGETSHYPYPYPKILFLTDADRPFPNEWLEIRTGLYFPTDRPKG